MAFIKENRDPIGHITKMTKEIDVITDQLNRLVLELRTPAHLLVEGQIRVTTKIEDEIKTLASQTKQVKQDLEEITQERPLSVNQVLMPPESVQKANQVAQVGEGRFKINATSSGKVKVVGKVKQFFCVR